MLSSQLAGLPVPVYLPFPVLASGVCASYMTSYVARFSRSDQPPARAGGALGIYPAAASSLPPRALGGELLRARLHPAFYALQLQVHPACAGGIQVYSPSPPLTCSYHSPVLSGQFRKVFGSCTPPNPPRIRDL